MLKNVFLFCLLFFLFPKIIFMYYLDHLDIVSNQVQIHHLFLYIHKEFLKLLYLNRHQFLFHEYHKLCVPHLCMLRLLTELLYLSQLFLQYTNHILLINYQQFFFLLPLILTLHLKLQIVCRFHLILDNHFHQLNLYL